MPPGHETPCGAPARGWARGDPAPAGDVAPGVAALARLLRARGRMGAIPPHVARPPAMVAGMDVPAPVPPPRHHPQRIAGSGPRPCGAGRGGTPGRPVAPAARMPAMRPGSGIMGGKGPRGPVANGPGGMPRPTGRLANVPASPAAAISRLAPAIRGLSAWRRIHHRPHGPHCAGTGQAAPAGRATMQRHRSRQCLLPLPRRLACRQGADAGPHRLSRTPARRGGRAHGPAAPSCNGARTWAVRERRWCSAHPAITRHDRPVGHATAQRGQPARHGAV
ncbi:hypothetical protein RAA17_14365 [Komagataeibacter rhaeticus]|nr:hypothetical protein [Komagataeibacter rhaeticus]